MPLPFTPVFPFRANRYRKALGGAMRQAGVLAAPALLALENAPEQLVADHAKCKRLAQGRFFEDFLRPGFVHGRK